MVLDEGRPVKACMVRLRAGHHIQPLDGLPVLSQNQNLPATQAVEIIEIPVLILEVGQRVFPLPSS